MVIAKYAAPPDWMDGHFLRDYAIHLQISVEVLLQYEVYRRCSQKDERTKSWFQPISALTAACKSGFDLTDTVTFWRFLPVM